MKCGLALLACCVTLLAADHISVRVEPGWASGNPDTSFDHADLQLRSGSFDPGAGELLGAAEQFTKRTFRVPSLKRQRAITYRDVWGDNLLAEWSIQEPFATGLIILRDTPFYSTYSMKLSAALRQTQAGLGEFLTGLIAWDGTPSRVPFLEVRIPSDYPNTAEFAGTPPVLYSEIGFIRDFNVWGRGMDGFLLLRFGVGKSLTSGVYPIRPFVPERFPSLIDLAASWDERRILSEIGKPNDRDSNGNPVLAGGRGCGSFTEDRDMVLITELARRGLSEAVLPKLLTDVAPQRLECRASIVFQALRDVGKGADFDRFFPVIVSSYEALGPSGSGGITAVFRELIRHKQCGAEFEKAALRLLGKRIAQSSSLFYLAECASSEESIKLIDAISVPEGLVPYKESTLLQIRNRLSSPY